MAEPFIIKWDMVMHYHELGYPPIRLVCQFPCQSHSEWLYDQIFFFSCIFCATDSFASKPGVKVHNYKLRCLVKRFDCCVKSQGHRKGLKFHLMFI